MRYGIIFPTMEIGTDPSVIRDWIFRASELGFDHVIVFDHVLGVDAAIRPDYGATFPVEGGTPPYVVEDEFHETIVTLSFIAALAPNLELSSGIIITPQRQTALLGKQLAELDVVSGGRLRLCAGVGWNPIEYEALQVDFHTRGRRMDAQIEALRALWINRVVDIDNEFEHIVGAGYSPNAVQRPIPIWIGAYQPKALERVGRIGDGWYHSKENPPQIRSDLDIIRRAAEAAGRDPHALGIEGGVEMTFGLNGMDERAKVREGYGATHIAIDPMHDRYRGAEHIAVLDKIAKQFPLTNQPGKRANRRS